MPMIAKDSTMPQDINMMTSNSQTGGRKEMSRYIDLDVYHAVERTHPFYMEMIAEIHRILRDMGCGSRPLTALEFGAGTGLATEELLGYRDLEITAVELDEQCADILRHVTGDRAEIVVADAVTFCREACFDVALSVFAHDHIIFDKGPELAVTLRRNLRRGGRYVMGGEILPLFDTESEHQESLYRYHCYIVEKALRDGHFEVAQIEISALKSGLLRIGDFKRHEDMFEREMLSADFRMIEKIKVGPSDRPDVGGVFVYVFEAM